MVCYVTIQLLDFSWIRRAPIHGWMVCIHDVCRCPEVAGPGVDPWVVVMKKLEGRHSILTSNVNWSGYST